MIISISKCEVKILDWKNVDRLLRVGGEPLPQVEFKYLWVFFTSERKMDRKIDRCIGVASAVMWLLFRSVLVKWELSRKKRLSIYPSIHVPIVMSSG